MYQVRSKPESVSIADCFHTTFSVVRTVDLHDIILNLHLISLPKFRIFEPAAQILYHTTAVDCRQRKKPYTNTKIESYQLREGTEAWGDGRSGERVRAGGRADRRLVTGASSWWGCALRSMRTKYHICQQFAEEGGHMSVNSGDLLGEASRDARLLQAPKRC